MSEVYAIVRLRGRVGVNYNLEHTLKLLRLHRVNHLVLYEANEVLKGMLDKVKHLVTYGEVDEKTVEHLLNKRGELIGKNKITNKHVKAKTEYSTIKQLSKAVATGNLKIKDIPDLTPVFRLSPPRKGFVSLKNPYNRKGDLGYRGNRINELIERMA